MLKRIKSLLGYLVILSLGLLIGFIAVNYKSLFRPDYIQGDYSEYFASFNAEHPVMMYGTSTCRYCADTRKYFQSKQIPFEDIDIIQNEKALKDMEKLGATGVPVVLIGDRMIPGFQPDAMDEALKLIHFPPRVPKVSAAQ